jgi:hypothetical protein
LTVSSTFQHDSKQMNKTYVEIHIYIYTGDAGEAGIYTQRVRNIQRRFDASCHVLCCFVVAFPTCVFNVCFWSCSGTAISKVLTFISARRWCRVSSVSGCGWGFVGPSRDRSETRRFANPTLLFLSGAPQVPGCQSSGFQSDLSLGPPGNPTLS